MLKKLLDQILNYMAIMGSSNLQDSAIQKSVERDKKLDKAMKAPIDKAELIKRMKP